MKRMIRAAYDARIPVMGSSTVRLEHGELVHPLEVPAQSPLCAFHFERPIALVSLNYATDLNVPPRAVSELHQGTNVILICDVASSAARRRSVLNECLAVPNHPLDGSRQIKAHI